MVKFSEKKSMLEHFRAKILKVRVYTEKIQKTPGIFHDIPLESVALLIFIHVYDLPETTEMNP